MHQTLDCVDRDAFAHVAETLALDANACFRVFVHARGAGTARFGAVGRAIHAHRGLFVRSRTGAHFRLATVRRKFSTERHESLIALLAHLIPRSRTGPLQRRHRHTGMAVALRGAGLNRRALSRLRLVRVVRELHDRVPRLAHAAELLTVGRAVFAHRRVPVLAGAFFHLAPILGGQEPEEEIVVHNEDSGRTRTCGRVEGRWRTSSFRCKIFGPLAD